MNRIYFGFVLMVAVSCAEPGPANSQCSPPDAGFVCNGKWCQVSSVANVPINRIWSADGGDLWFVGNGGTILRYLGPDAGTPWVREDAGTTTDLYAVWGSSPKDVWVAGIPWEQRSPTYNLYNLFHYVQGASPSWSMLSMPQYSTNFQVFRDGEVNVLWGTEVPGVVQFAGCSSMLGAYSVDSGTWSAPPEIKQLRTYGAWAASSADQWIVGRGFALGAKGPEGAPSAIGRMFRNQNGGWWNEASAGQKLWSAELQTAVDGGSWFTDIRGTSANDVWAVGTKGLVAHFDGNIWNLLDAGIGSTTNVYGVWPVSDKEVWFAGGVPGTSATPKLFRYLNQGGTVTWPTITVPQNVGLLYRVWTSGSGCGVWVSGTTGIWLYRP